MSNRVSKTIVAKSIVLNRIFRTIAAAKSIVLNRIFRTIAAAKSIVTETNTIFKITPHKK